MPKAPCPDPMRGPPPTPQPAMAEIRTHPSPGPPRTAGFLRSVRRCSREPEKLYRPTG
ncbi:hypothetical protein STRAU_1007 [Streptomyces aurantiacus JA 4570]|uniref:Uncharacterized protein n=1 Tax=Streptomyces aurantiacus JA 4570 TaxID=1286094 RepID=S4A596_9ACTN|nr:hypothetical protein STRAU_1007 [Streptomyces aurantiacus JA 4570]